MIPQSVSDLILLGIQKFIRDEVKKMEIIEAIESQMDRFNESISCKMDHYADSLETLISEQNRLTAIIANTAGMQINLLYPFKSSTTQVSHAVFSILTCILPAG